MFKLILKTALYKNTYSPNYSSKVYFNDNDIKMQAIRKYYLEYNKQYYNTMTNELKKNYKKNIVNNNIHLL
jgi:hypothetical protein